MYRNNEEKNQNQYLVMGIITGLLVGARIGILFDEIGLGAGLGMLLGILIGVLLDKNTKDVKKHVIKIVAISMIGAVLITSIPILFTYLR